MGFINIEIKAKCTNAARIRNMLEYENAEFVGVDNQVDTYFRVNQGRMKLREGNVENALIYYNREDIEGPKKSEIVTFQTNPGTTLKEVLANSLGVLAVIRKRREIYLSGNVKFHIDVIEELGSFIEIEAINKNGEFTEEKLRSQCDYFINLFKINTKDLIPGSYSDLIPQVVNP